MTDFDSELRALGDDLRVDPTLPAAEIRRRGARRRTRRHLAVGGAALAAVAAVALAVDLAGRPLANPPAGSSSTTSTSIPPNVRQIHADPRVFAAAPGGSGLARPTATVEGYAALDPASGCLVLSDAPTITASMPATHQAPRALVFPVGSTWTTNPVPGVALGDTRRVTPGAKMVVKVVISPRSDNLLQGVCPGTAGVASIPTAADVLQIDGQPADPSTPGTPSGQWARTITDFPLGQGLSAAGDQTLGPITHDIRHQGGLDPCLHLAEIPSVDAIEMTLDSPAEQLVRQLRLFDEEASAKANVASWQDAARSCEGKTVTGPSGVTLSYDVIDLGTDELMIVQSAKTATGGLFPWMGVMGIKRVGNAVLTTSSTTEAMATPDNVDQAKVATAESLGMLGKFMCSYGTGGC